ncbi:MAG: hypothetical protein R6W82_06260 [bacterium]
MDRSFFPSLAALLILTACAAGGMGGSPYEDIVGTWTGPAFAEGDDMGVDVTMIIEERDGALRGTVSVPEQMLRGAALRDLTWEDGVLSGWLSMQGMRVDVRLRREEEALNGTFYADGLSGFMSLSRSGG